MFQFTVFIYNLIIKLGIEHNQNLEFIYYKRYECKSYKIVEDENSTLVYTGNLISLIKTIINTF